MINNQTISLKHSAWFGDHDCEIGFPSTWSISVYEPSIREAMLKSDVVSEIRNVVDTTAACYRTRSGKVAVITDDLTRPTPTDELLSTFLPMLVDAGVPAQKILVVTGGGTHAPLDQQGLVRKLGSWVCDNFRVSSHNPHKHLINCGRSSNGTPILLNQEVYACSTRVGIGGVYPHALAGFGGGSKLILGFCGFRTIANLHYGFSGSKLGGEIENPFRAELRAIGQHLKLDAFVNVLVNKDRKIAKLFTGDIDESHSRAIRACRALYCVPAPDDADVVVASTYPFDTMFLFSKKGWWPTGIAKPSAARVIIGGFPAGLGFHGLHPMRLSRQAKIRHKCFVMLQLNRMRMLRCLLDSAKSPFQPKTKKTNVEKKPLMFQPHANSALAGFDIETDWKCVLGRITAQFGDTPKRVVVYSCSPLLFVG